MEGHESHLCPLVGLAYSTVERVGARAGPISLAGLGYSSVYLPRCSETAVTPLNVNITLNVKNQCENAKKAGPLNVKKYQR